MSLRFLPSARRELDAEASYLDKRVPGLGGELVDDVERTGALVDEFPDIGRPLDSVHRLVPAQRFSFNLVYRTVGGDYGDNRGGAPAQTTRVLAKTQLTANNLD